MVGQKYNVLIYFANIRIHTGQPIGLSAIYH